MNEQELQYTRELLAAGLRGEGAHLTLEDAVRDFPESLMNEKPPHVPYSFWHQLEHIRIAQEDLFLYASSPGNVSPSWPEGYWPDVGETADQDTWNATIAAIKADRSRFVEFISAPDTDLFARAEHMNGGSVFRTAMLAIDHTAYHLGEFVMGRQILGYWQSALDQ